VGYDWTMPPSRYMPFMVAALAIAVGLASAWWLDWELAVILAANGFFVTYQLLETPRIGRLTQEYLRKYAANSDAPLPFIYATTLATVTAALVSLFIVINAPGDASAVRLTLALASVPLGWATIHLMAAIHYAHLFWQPGPGEGKPRLGLTFPGTREPEGWDFVYFAFVIGMAAQTSDVAITGAHIRKFALAHSIAAFFFNTVLVAAAVNFAVSLD